MRCISTLILVALLQALFGADATDTPKPVPSLGTLIHDLRDFLPEAESTKGGPDDPIRALSVKDDGMWKVYRSYNKSHTGYLSRTEIKALVADLITSLRVNYPETFADIDVDGDDTITLAKFQAYQKKHQH